MNWKYSYWAWLLFTLMGTGVFAQTPPKKRVGKPVVVQPQVTERPKPSAEPWQCRISEIEFIENMRILERGRDTLVQPFDPDQAWMYVEKMPTLNGQPAGIGSLAVINRYLVVPPDALEGRVSVQFVIDKEGRVRYPKIARGLRADLDSAVIAATRQLPRFTPGQQAGQAVNVLIILPVTIPVKKQP